MEYNAVKACDYRYLKRYLRGMRRIRYRRERAGFCLLLLCAILYLTFAGAYRDVLFRVREDHSLEYVMPGEREGERDRLQIDFNLLHGEFRITRERSGPDPVGENAGK